VKADALENPGYELLRDRPPCGRLKTDLISPPDGPNLID
jgi:hypothetical protein